MGEVWAALHEEMGREVALKLIHGQAPDLAVRLKREAQAYGRLEHANVVRIYDIGETEEGDPFLVMQLLTGETLADRVARQHRLSTVEALRIALYVGSALRAAHAAGIVHRDLKPANVYLHRAPGAEDEEVKVLDFGVSKILSMGDTAFTVTGALIGSPAYMSPEQARASKELDPRADIWSLGVVLFEMLTGSRPFPNASPIGVIADILAAPIPRLAEILPGVDPRLDDVVSRCMEREVHQRMPSAAALIEALRPVLTLVEHASAATVKQYLPSFPDHVAYSPPAAPRRGSTPPPTPSDEPPTTLIDRDALYRAGAPATPAGHATASTSGDEPPTKLIDREALYRTGVRIEEPASDERTAKFEKAPVRTLPLPISVLAAADDWEDNPAAITKPLVREPKPPPATETLLAAMPPEWQPKRRDRNKVLLMSTIAGLSIGLSILIAFGLSGEDSQSSPDASTPPAVSAAASDAPKAGLPPPTPAPPEASDSAIATAAPTASVEPEPTSRPADRAERRYGLVNFSSSPASHVLLDAKPMGSTPLSGVPVMAGSHRITFIHPTRGSRVITINVKAEQRTTANVRFD